MTEVARKFLILILMLTLFSCTQEKAQEVAKPQAGEQPPPLTAPWQKQKTTTPQPESTPSVHLVLLDQPMQLQTFERPSEAIPVWRNYRSAMPALIVISQSPMFGTVPDILRTEANDLVMNADSNQLRTQANNQIANPVLLPQQSVAAALNAQFFSEVIWILPHKEKDEISPELFRKHMVDSGTLWPEEAATIKSEGGVFRGKARGYPFTACRIDRLPKITGACLVHLDLSYFSGRFDNEITTPLFPLVHETLQTLRQAKLRPLAVTLSLGNREGGVPLEIRFLKNLLTDTLQNPALLDQPLPELLAMRKDARYLESFFQTDGMLTIYNTMAKMTKNDASIHYDLYRTYWTAREIELALQHLDYAVLLDPGYGVEYLHLAVKQLDKQNLEDGLKYLQRCASIEPGNPFISLQLAEAYLLSGKKKEALDLIKTLSQEKWSAIYFQEIPQLLEEMKKKAES